MEESKFIAGRILLDQLVCRAAVSQPLMTLGTYSAPAYVTVLPIAGTAYNQCRTASAIRLIAPLIRYLIWKSDSVQLERIRIQMLAGRFA